MIGYCVTLCCAVRLQKQQQQEQLRQRRLRQEQLRRRQLRGQQQLQQRQQLADDVRRRALVRRVFRALVRHTQVRHCDSAAAYTMDVGLIHRAVRIADTAEKQYSTGLAPIVESCVYCC